MVMGNPESARTTALYQTEDSSQLVTFPITEAVGAMKVSFVWNGFWFRKAIVGRWRVNTYNKREITIRHLIITRETAGESHTDRHEKLRMSRPEHPNRSGNF